VNDREERVAQAWAPIDDYGGREDEFRALIDSLAAELPDGDPVAAFERACAWGLERATPIALYRSTSGPLSMR
jgi:hypothetical protein